MKRLYMDNNSNIKLSKSPIIETTLDIVCSFNVPTDVILGIMYNSLNNTFGKLNVQGLPILNLPEQLRESDSNLRNKPTHRIDCGQGIVSVGPHIISISILPPYKNWEEYVGFITQIITIIKELNIIGNIHTLNLRYLNFLKSNVFDKINLNISIAGNKISYPSTVLRTEIPVDIYGKMVNVLQVTNSVHVKNEAMGLDNDGSLIDIVVVNKNTDLDNLLNSIVHNHESAKELFFSLLSEELLNELI